MKMVLITNKQCVHLQHSSQHLLYRGILEYPPRSAGGSLQLQLFNFKLGTDKQFGIVTKQSSISWLLLNDLQT